MTIKIEQAARQALSALMLGGLLKKKQAITALREALAEQAEQEALMITPGGGAFPFAVVGELEQAEQEPVAWVTAKESFCGFPKLVFSETQKDGYKPLYAAPVRTKDYNPDVTFNDDGTFSLMLPDGDELRIILPQQEPTAEVSEDGYAWGKDGILPAGTKLYAAPVCTKDLTADEIEEFYTRIWSGGKKSMFAFARAVIAAYREKNK